MCRDERRDKIDSNNAKKIKKCASLKIDNNKKLKKTEPLILIIRSSDRNLGNLRNLRIFSLKDSNIFCC